jgi:hypothetical protein
MKPLHDYSGPESSDTVERSLPTALTRAMALGSPRYFVTLVGRHGERDRPECRPARRKALWYENRAVTFARLPELLGVDPEPSKRTAALFAVALTWLTNGKGSPAMMRDR